MIGERLLGTLTLVHQTPGHFSEDDKRQFGYSRDKRPDCVQVVLALIVTPEGFPLAYEVWWARAKDV